MQLEPCIPGMTHAFEHGYRLDSELGCIRRIKASYMATRGAQSRDDREMQAIERMVQEAIQRRKEREQQAPAHSDAPSDTPAPSVLDRIGQDKRRFTF